MTTNPEFEVAWQPAREIAHKAANRSEIIQVALSQAGGMVLARDICALGDMPPFAASRIDGWAVSGPGPWHHVGEALAGREFVNKLNSGECVHTATGAVMPQGASAALKDEESRLEAAYVYAIEGAVGLLDQGGSLPYFHDVRPSGYEAKLGEVLIPSGTKITPALIGVAAGAGHDVLPVFKKIIVDVLIFGDELLETGPSRDGKIRDSLGPQLPLWIDELDAQLNLVTHVSDTLADHVAAISNSNADLIITTGSTASGPMDHLHSAIAEVGGKFLIDAVLVRPGYHQLMARIGEQILIGLPGNPQSAVIGLLTLAAPLISGAYAKPLTNLEVRTIVPDVSGFNREVRLVLGAQDAGMVNPVEHLDSSMLRGFVSASGYAVIPPGGAKSGQQVQWIALPSS